MKNFTSFCRLFAISSIFVLTLFFLGCKEKKTNPVQTNDNCLTITSLSGSNEEITIGDSIVINIVITNVCGIKKHIDYIYINGNNQNDFTLNPYLPFPIPIQFPMEINIGEKIQIGIIFKPSSIGNKTANLHVTSSSNNDNVYILNGTGVK